MGDEGVKPRGSNFLVVSWGKLEQDWRCLLSKQGMETPHPRRLAGMEQGVSPDPRQFTLNLAKGSRVPFPVH